MFKRSEQAKVKKFCVSAPIIQEKPYILQTLEHLQDSFKVLRIDLTWLILRYVMRVQMSTQKSLKFTKGREVANYSEVSNCLIKIETRQKVTNHKNSNLQLKAK